MKELNREEFIKLADGLLDAAKKSLEDDGKVSPVAYIMCSKMEVGPWLRKTLMDGVTGEMVTDDQVGATGEDDLTLVIPCYYGNHPLLIHMLTYLSTNQEQMGQMFNFLRATGPGVGIKDPDARIVEGFKQKFGLTEKDIVADFIKKVCKETKAHAVVKIDEAYSLVLKQKEGQSAKEAREEFPKNLKDAPGRLEIIQIAVETATFRRFTMQNFSRQSEDEQQENYKKIIWGELIQHEDTVDQQKLTGRFTNFIMPPPQEDLYTRKAAPPL